MYGDVTYDAHEIRSKGSPGLPLDTRVEDEYMVYVQCYHYNGHRYALERRVPREEFREAIMVEGGYQRMKERMYRECEPTVRLIR